jgi:tRNA(Met) C34 N-acetyltransferase TmcA
MTENTLKKVKISIKGEGKVLAILKEILKTDNLKYIRDKNPKITQQYQFVDGDDLIDFDIEADYEVGDIIDDDGKIFIKSNNNKMILENRNEQMEKKLFDESTDDNESKIKEEVNNEFKQKEDPIINEDEQKEDPIINEDEQKENEKLSEEKKPNLDEELIELINKLSDTNKDLVQKCIKIFEDNGIKSIKDLLLLKKEDIDGIGFKQFLKENY